MKKLVISILLSLLVSCGHTQRRPSSTSALKGPMAIKVFESLEGSVLKYSGSGMGQGFYETIKGTCVIFNEEVKAELRCNDKFVATEAEASDTLEFLKESVLVYSGYNMGKAYYDIQGGVTCSFSNGKSDGGSKYARLSCQ